MIVNFEFMHDIDLVYKTITDPQFLKQRALQLGSFDAQSSAQQVEANNQVTLIRQRNIKVPAVLRSLLKTVQTATTNETWCRSGDSYSCENTTDIDGAPLSIAGNITLKPLPNGCAFQASFEPDAKVRFFAGRLRKYAAKTVAKEIELECDYTARHLASLLTPQV